MHLLLTNLFCVILLINPTVIIFNTCCKVRSETLRYCTLWNGKKEPYNRCNKTFSIKPSIYLPSGALV